MILSKSVLATLFASVPSLVDGHGYLEKPLSRNLYAYQSGNGDWNPGKAGTPWLDYNYQSVNGNTGICGKTQLFNPPAAQYDYTEWTDSTGQPMPWIVQETYSKGQIIDVAVKLTAEHCGFFEMKGCPMGRDSTQDCFDSYPLEFIEDVTSDHSTMPKDPDYPYRAHFAKGAVNKNLSYKFKLPDDLVGPEVLLQWIYWTGNSCWLEGYDQYITEVSGKPSGDYCLAAGQCPPREKIAWIRDPNFADSANPELFWNCAEVAITGEPTPTPPFAPPTPVSQPVAEPTSISNPTQPEIPGGSGPGQVGTCGNQNTGNCICPDTSMCCSEWGYCGTSSEHCNGKCKPTDSGGGGGGVTPTTPVAPPTPAAPVTPGDGGTPGGGDHSHDGDHNPNERLIAYLGNWHPCPTPEQLSQYTHIVVAFAVTYTWAQSKNICSQDCSISDPPVCNNSPHPELIQQWKDMGIKVILSFGGAGMGGSWDGDQNDCWDYCFGRETQVVDRLVEIVMDKGYDGIDIDYEYFYEDYMNGSPFTKGAEAQKFLKDVTLGLREKMPEGYELTHAPMEPDLTPNRAYFKVMAEVADSLDFLMPQYYNGYVRSLENFPGALSHYTNIVDGIFKGDATKVVYGFCSKDCSSFNLDGYQSSQVMEMLTEAYPCNGGAFFWVANDDPQGEWSKPMQGQLGANGEHCPSESNPDVPVSDPTAAPVAPVADPTAAPVAPVADPTVAPVAPVADPTSAPVAPVADPTELPVADPTSAPVSPVADPTSAPEPTGDCGTPCCSQNFKTCAGWGGDSKESCESMGSMKWLECGPIDSECLGKDASCTNNVDSCCPDLSCDGNEWYRQCKYVPNLGRKRHLKQGAVRAF